MDENPYSSPAESEPPAEATPPRDATPNDMARYAQLGLRLLGVMLLAEGLIGLVGSSIFGAIDLWQLVQDGYDPSPDPYVYGWFASSVVSFVIGLYLIVSGRWVLTNVFLPAE